MKPTGRNKPHKFICSECGKRTKFGVIEYGLVYCTACSNVPMQWAQFLGDKLFEDEKNEKNL